MALATADIHVKVDPAIKKRAEKKFKEDGITMSDFININLRRYLRSDARTNAKTIELPENLRIRSQEDLVNFLEKRASDDNGVRYASEEMREMLSERLGVSI